MVTTTGQCTTDGAAPSTKVYYYLDDNTPYLSVVPVADDMITLGDFKRVFNKKGYKYFCKQLDKAIGCEVKVEIHDNATKLAKSANGLIELVLLSTSDNIYCSGTLPRVSAKANKAHSCGKLQDFNLRKRRSLHDDLTTSENFGNNHGDRNKSNENSITASSLTTVISKRAGEGLAELYTSNSEDTYRLDEQLTSRYKQSGACSSAYPNSLIVNPRVGCVRRERRPRKERYRKAYVPSTISSITESRFAWQSYKKCIIICTAIWLLPKPSMLFDGYAGGAVDLDGRIEIGDQIVQVNRNSFENLRDVEAVDLLRKAAASCKPVTLYVAKRTSSNSEQRANILSGIASETMPIDISLWVESTKYNIAKPPKDIEEGASAMNGDVTAVEASETDLEGAYAERQSGVPSNSQVCSKLKQLNSPDTNIAFSVEDMARRRENEENVISAVSHDVKRSHLLATKHLFCKNGLFSGRDLVDWLMEHVHGITDRKAARAYASRLLAGGHIRHVVNKLTFTEKCYYVFEGNSRFFWGICWKEICRLQGCSFLHIF
ncbi:unnamed protein product [Gongylonema pulchrum]|uniref:Segment polarity protein dishevelled-like protein DVL-3 n=1 Tax=Gongylonema pulchrum TaxID=637853 RepID=A0A183DQE8_9BILA|nr:unnamed protein product [Gongylonema pulchrum]